jgi:hypothetical protein
MITRTYPYYEYYKFVKSKARPDNWGYRPALRAPRLRPVRFPAGPVELPLADPAGGTKAATQTMSDRVYIFDTTLRDGEQSPGCSMTVPEKTRMAHKLVELGVDILEAGFPIASDGDFEAVDCISREFHWVTVAALGRACTLDIERAARSLEHARRPRIHTFIATSELHLKYKLKKSQQQVLDEAVAAVELARRYADDVEFSAEDEIGRAHV